MIPEMEYIRLAAFVDGEGCVRISRGHKGRYALRLVIVNTDPRLLVWAKRTFGGCIGRMYIQPQRKDLDHPRFFWEVAGPTAARLLEKCLPYSLIKKEEIEIALTFQATKTSTWGAGRSQKKGLPDYVREHRKELAEKLTLVKNTRPKLEDVLAKAV